MYIFFHLFQSSLINQVLSLQREDRKLASNSNFLQTIGFKVVDEVSIDSYRDDSSSRGDHRSDSGLWKITWLRFKSQ